MTQPERILLIRVDGIGDLVMCIGALTALRKKFPDAKIDLLTSDAASTIGKMLMDAGVIAQMFVLPLLGRSRQHQRDMAKQLAGQNYDIGFDLRGDMRNIWMMWQAGIACRVGLAGTALSYLLTDRVVVEPGTHQLHECAQLMTLIGVSDVENQTALPLREDDRLAAKAWLGRHGRDPSKKLVAIHPSAFVPSKVWPLERFVEVARQLMTECGCQIVVVGGKAELPIAGQFSSALALPDVMIATGQTSLAVTAAILAECDAMVGNDSGPAHMAAAVGTAPVVLFSCTRVERYHPVSAKLKILRPDQPCDPQCDRECVRGTQHCMLQYTPRQVVDLAKQAMSL